MGRLYGSPLSGNVNDIRERRIDRYVGRYRKSRRSRRMARRGEARRREATATVTYVSTCERIEVTCLLQTDTHGYLPRMEQRNGRSYQINVMQNVSVVPDDNTKFSYTTILCATIRQELRLIKSPFDNLVFKRSGHVSCK